MKRIALICLLALALPAAAQADCYVVYKAKKDRPLDLHYGVLRLSGGCPSAAQAGGIVASRIGRDGWKVLTVLSVSPATPSAQVRADAGSYYLRY